MNRRAFVIAPGAAGIGRAHAQTPRLPRVAFLFPGSPEEDPEEFAALRNSLAELGYADGKTVIIESKWASGRMDTLPLLAAELVRDRPDVIVARGGRAVPAAIGASGSIAVVIDERVDLANALVPPGSTVGLLRSDDPTHDRRTSQAVDAGRATHLNVVGSKATKPAELAGAFSALAKEQAHAVIVFPDSMFYFNRHAVLALEAKHSMIGIHPRREYAIAGGLPSYGPDILALHRGSAAYVQKILQGAKPGDLAIEQPTKLELIVNRKTAKALGVTVPSGLLLRADEVIH